MKNYSQTQYYQIAEVLAPITTFTIKNLQAGARYRFRVAAKNKFGYGEVSAEAKIWLQTKVIGIFNQNCLSYLKFSFHNFFSSIICIFKK